jgi:hypothetical protein
MVGAKSETEGRMDIDLAGQNFTPIPEKKPNEFIRQRTSVF